MIWQKRFGTEMIAVIVMIAVVSVLAVYQYRWTDEISRTEQARLKSSLATSVRNFDQEFSYDVQHLCENFELGPETESSTTEAQLARQQANWMRTSAHAEFVRALYIWTNGSSGLSRLRVLNPDDTTFHDTSWAPELESLRSFLQGRKELFPASIEDRDAVYFPWIFFQGATSLVRPIFEDTSPGRGAASGVHTSGILVVALNREYLERRYLPDLVERHFGAAGQRSFVLSVRTMQAPYQTIYLSEARAPIESSKADATINLFDLVGDEARRRGHPPLQASTPGEQWQLVARDPSGSLEEAVASWRRRNLRITLGLLAVLAVSVVLIFSGARRSRALARMQMEFVAGVSHELCTPLAVINTAAENLADGVVEDAQQMQEYGGLIRAHGRRLGRLVDEVLLFTAGRFGLSGYDVEAVEIAPIIDQSLASSEASLHDAGFTLIREIANGLPPVMADSSATITCIENLVSNAAKYSSSSKRIAIRAYEAPDKSNPEVLVAVEDHGIGISSADIAHIFEPFYRVQSVRDHQIRGVGLGLYLVKRMMKDMGGDVSVRSELGRGTEVVLHFPLAESAEQNETNAQRKDLKLQI